MKKNLKVLFDERTQLIGITIIAFIVRIIRYFLTTRIDKDAILYVQIAKRIADGHINNAFGALPRVPPLYVFLMGKLSGLLGITPESSGVIVSVVAGSLLVIPVFFATKLLFSKKVALISSLIVVLHPYLIRISTEVLRDSLYIFLFFTALTFVIYAVKTSSSLAWYIAGIFTGLATLTRSEGMEIIFGVLVWIGLEIAIFIKNRDRISVVKRECKNFEFNSGSVNLRGVCTWKRIVNYLGGLLVLLTMCLFITVSTQRMLVKTDSVWSAPDTRIISLFHGFFSLPGEKIYNKVRGK